MPSLASESWVTAGHRPLRFGPHSTKLARIRPTCWANLTESGTNSGPALDRIWPDLSTKFEADLAGVVRTSVWNWSNFRQHCPSFGRIRANLAELGPSSVEIEPTLPDIVPYLDEAGPNLVGRCLGIPRTVARFLVKPPAHGPTSAIPTGATVCVCLGDWPVSEVGSSHAGSAWMSARVTVPPQATVWAACERQVALKAVAHGGWANP